MLTKESPFFSIIVPVYNVKDYLTQCIESIISQDYEDYEILLIDDGSNDGSESLCDKFETKLSHCKVFHKANGGLSDARNVGLQEARGSYIWFIDSDDYLIDDKAFSKVADVIREEKVDVVLFSYKKYYEQSNVYSQSIISEVSDIRDVKELIRTNAYKALGCNKVVKHDLIIKNKMYFPIGRFGEDLGWCADLLAYANGSMALCESDLFAYRQRLGSITNNKSRQHRMQHIGDTLFLINESLRKYNLGMNTEDENSLIGHYLAYEFSWLLGEAYNYWKEYSKEIKRLSFILDYNLNRKVSKVKKLERFLGIKGTSFVLNLFIKIKSTWGN